ncbi:MAG: insulinase family protein [Alphaproteobacteria bacterium]|nr:insulinase family protein [Alphaproteobacteria bacterium]
MFRLNILRLALLGFLLTVPDAVHAAIFYPTHFTLGNGLEVIVVPNHVAPVVTQMVWYKVGASDEVGKKRGIAHYLEHLMFRGTPSIPDGEFSKIIASQGGTENAFTSYDYTAYFETVAADRLPMIMQMEADRMHNLVIAPDTAKPELSVVLNERQQRTDNNPIGRFVEKVRHTLLPHHPYGLPLIGFRHQIESLTAADAQAFYNAHYAPNNAVVVISGDVTPDDVMRLAASIYGAVPRRDVEARRALPPATLPKSGSFSMVDAGIEQPQVELHIVVPSYHTQKQQEAYAYEVLNAILDEGESGLLYRRLVRGKGLASGVASSYDPDARGDADLTIAISPAPEKKVAQVEKALRDTLNDLAQKGLDDKAVNDAKARLKREAIFARDSLMMPGYVFGSALATGHSVAAVEAWPQRIEAVTTEQVNDALRDMLKNPHTLVAELLPDPHASQAAREAAQPVLSQDRGVR